MPEMQSNPCSHFPQGFILLATATSFGFERIARSALLNLYQLKQGTGVPLGARGKNDKALSLSPSLIAIAPLSSIIADMEGLL